MIITCEKCSKTFNIQDKLVPEKGRLLQCGNCNHKWFFIPIKKYTVPPTLFERRIPYPSSYAPLVSPKFVGELSHHVEVESNPTPELIFPHFPSFSMYAWALLLLRINELFALILLYKLVAAVSVELFVENTIHF